jgi:hypothetical protein
MRILISLENTTQNPILDTLFYEVDFEDKQIGTYAANVIAENIYEQVDEEGQDHVLFDSFIDHKKGSNALSGEDALVQEGGKTYPKRTTKGWKLCVQWQDGSTSWLSLKDLKELHPFACGRICYSSQVNT